MIVNWSTFVNLRHIQITNRQNVVFAIWSFKEIFCDVRVLYFELLELFVRQRFIVAAFSKCGQ